MDLLAALWQAAWSRIDAMVFSASGWRNFGMPAVILLVSVLLELGARRDLRLRYGSRHFRLDVIYFVFYYGGFYHLLVFAWLYRTLAGAVSAHAPWLQMNLLTEMHPAAQIAIVILMADFVGYWSHRWRHANGALWHFHAIHHSQTRLTVFTNYRFHVIDETLLRLCLFIPFQMLGTSVEIWLLLDFVMGWVLLLQHSEWNWTYGKLGRVLVSPVFHRKHHSIDESSQNRNFGMLFTFWDDLFGTADRRPALPAPHGIAGDPVPESFWGQLVYPFEANWQDWKRRAAPVPAPAPDR